MCIKKLTETFKRSDGLCTMKEAYFTSLYYKYILVIDTTNELIRNNNKKNSLYLISLDNYNNTGNYSQELGIDIYLSI